MWLSRMPTGEWEIFASVQGEGFSIGVPSVFVRLAECNLKCTWCFVPETPILMGDWTWKPLGEVKAGECVVGLEQPSTPRAHIKLARGSVTRVSTRLASTVAVNGALRTTSDHKFWITGHDASRRPGVAHRGWREIERSRGLRVLFTAEPVNHDAALYQRGWLAGMADGDGCFWTLSFRRGYRRFRLALNEENLLGQAEAFATNAGFALRRGSHSAVGFVPRARKMNALYMTSDGAAQAFEAWIDEDVDNRSWQAGYLGGILDAEGSLSGGQLRISQYESNQATRDRITRVLRGLDVRHTIDRNAFYLHGTAGAGLRVLCLGKPAKTSIINNSFGHHPHASRVIESVEPTGRSETVVTLSTTLGSFVAGGYVVKNCDTKYTWDWDHHDRARETAEVPLDAVVARVLEVAGDSIRNVVITGGEPLLHQRDLGGMASRLRELGFRIEVETNATVEPTQELIGLVDQWNVSPKLATSGNRRSARLRTGPLTRFAGLQTATFKFVVCEPTDLAEIDDLVARFSLPHDRTLLMPQATDASGLQERSRWLVALCAERGLRFGTRLHVQLWGGGRGR